MSNLMPEDESLLERARAGDAATPDDQARVKRKLLVQLGVGLGVTTSAGSAAGTGVGTGMAAGGVVAGTTGATLGIVGKVVAVAGVVAALGGGAAAVHHWRTAGATTAAPPVASSISAGTSTGAPAVPTFNPPPTTAAPVVNAAPTQPPPVAATVTVQLPGHVREPVPAHRIPEPAPIVREWSDVPAATTTATPTATTTTTAMPSPPSGPATLDAEADLLRRADAARKNGDPAGALALLEQHRARFPNGVLVEEREAERIVVLCALGRADEARAAGARFLREHPRSPMAARVRASCAGAGGD